ncbi:MAG TPA: hypothetical protein ENK43_03380 [Planctomycetes bacterium]|nr:hypothetical protein [Planctomycetota bacterium]
MKIYFCDKCNQSIPLKDIESNRISIDSGRIYCEKCAPRPTGHRRTFSGWSTLLLMLLLGAGVGAGVMAVWGDEIMGNQGPGSTKDRLGKLERAIGELRVETETRLRTVETNMEETPAADGSVGRLARVIGGVRANAEALQDLRRRLDGLADDLRTQLANQEKARAAFAKSIEERIDLLEQRLDDQRVAEDLDDFRARIEDLEQVRDALESRLRALERSGTVGVPVAKEADSGSTVLDPETESRFQKILSQLESADPATRFNAVVDLASIPGRRSEEALAKALDDKADYVRIAALQNLADLSAKWAIPRIIPKLKDENIFVRETAISSLETLTGQPLKLDASDPSSKIQAKIREMESWWKNNKGRILGS